jgi:putative DNA primase/helicase
VLALDNVSYLPPSLSDALCRLSTGGGFATRWLWTNDEEALFDGQRPQLLNGITEVAKRGDLRDRTISVALQRIPDERRRTEQEIMDAFKAAHPRILGALCSAASTALRRLANVRLERLPRMADFALWAVAAEPALDILPGAFIAAYAEMGQASLVVALEESAVGDWIRRVADDGGFDGTASELLELADETTTRRRKGFPQDAARLASTLRRLAPSLRAVGTNVEFADRRELGPRRRRIVINRSAFEKQPHPREGEHDGDQRNVGPHLPFQPFRRVTGRENGNKNSQRQAQ